MSSRQSKSLGSSSRGSGTSSRSTGTSKISTTSSRSTSSAKSSAPGSTSAKSVQSSKISTTSSRSTSSAKSSAPSSTSAKSVQSSKSSTTSSKSTPNAAEQFQSVAISKTTSTAPKTSRTKTSSANSKSSSSSNNCTSLLFDSDGFSSSRGLVNPSVLESYVRDFPNFESAHSSRSRGTKSTRGNKSSTFLTFNQNQSVFITTTRSPQTLVYDDKKVNPINPIDWILDGSPRILKTTSSSVYHDEPNDALEQINQILYGTTSVPEKSRGSTTSIKSPNERPSYSLNDFLNQTITSGDSKSKGAIKKSETNISSTSKTNPEEQTSRTLRSRGKYKDFTHEPGKVTDFSIDNFLDSYKKNEVHYKNKVDTILEDFKIPKENRREGNEKLSYNYLLLDSRKCPDISNASWNEFKDAIFYVGKGKNNRSFDHTKDAENTKETLSKKINTIKDIWNDGKSVKVLQLTKNIIAEDAYTREAAMIDALGKKNLTNVKSGTYYGVTTTIPTIDKLEMGGALLVDAWKQLKTESAVDVFPKNLNNNNEVIVNSILNDRANEILKYNVDQLTGSLSNFHV